MEIYILRCQLDTLYKSYRKLSNHDILLKSQELDLLIIKYQKECKIKET
ncbi:Spo0E family sporulation regulatory protein-aspartic acid phosphatase [Bacillus coreaensis]